MHHDIFSGRFSYVAECTCKIVHLTTVLVVVLCVAPDETDFLFEGIPSLEVGDSSVFVASMFAINTLAHQSVSDGSGDLWVSVDVSGMQ